LRKPSPPCPGNKTTLIASAIAGYKVDNKDYTEDNIDLREM